MSATHELVLICDFGSQYTQLIARRVRELSVFCEVVPYTAALDAARARRPRGIILSGGPDSVYAEGAPRVSADLFSLGIPVLGVCYGMQLMMHLLGGDVRPAAGREYGPAVVRVTDRTSLLLREVAPELRVWASHGDHVAAAAAGFRTVAASDNAPLAAVEHAGARLYGVQFHPEVAHTEHGREVLRNFLYDAWVYLGAGANNISNLEFDMNQVMANGRTVIYGFQCDSWSKTWDYTANLGTPTAPNDTWLPSTAACNVQNWSPNTWHHVQIAYSRDAGGNVTYKSVWLDNVQQDLNVTVNSAFALGWSPTLLTNFQVDGMTQASSNSTVYLDNLTVYRW